MNGLMVGLALTQAQAASLDYAKANTKVEKHICADAQLSKRDEALFGITTNWGLVA
jgi:uncharacterized protein